MEAAPGMYGRQGETWIVGFDGLTVIARACRPMWVDAYSGYLQLAACMSAQGTKHGALCAKELWVRRERSNSHASDQRPPTLLRVLIKVQESSQASSGMGGRGCRRCTIASGMSVEQQGFVDRQICLSSVAEPLMPTSVSRMPRSSTELTLHNAGHWHVRI